MPKHHIIALFILHAGRCNQCVSCGQKKIAGADAPDTLKARGRKPGFVGNWLEKTMIF